MPTPSADRGKSGQMQLVQILLPLTDNDDKPFPKRMFEALKEDLTRQYQGVTAFIQAPAQGQWAPDDTSISKEDIVIFEVMVKGLRLEEWQQRRRDLEASFQQERVVIRYMAIGLI